METKVYEAYGAVDVEHERQWPIAKRVYPALMRVFNIPEAVSRSRLRVPELLVYGLIDEDRNPGAGLEEDVMNFTWAQMLFGQIAALVTGLLLYEKFFSGCPK